MLNRQTEGFATDYKPVIPVYPLFFYIRALPIFYMDILYLI